jgi:hypothetical protein
MDSSKSSNLVPDPPLLPPVFNLNDHIAAIDPVVGKFVTIPRTPGVRYPRSLGPTNGKVNLKLGPPSKAPDWHPLLEKWGLQVLDAAGFVNSTASNPFRTSLGPLSKHKPKVTGQQRHGAKHQIIHPVFREDLWEDLLEGEYKLMEPALRLASAIIDEPDTLGFFAGLTIPSEEMSWIYSSRLGRVPVFHATEPLKGKELIDIYNKVHNMRKYLKWKMVDGEPLVEELECFAVTSYVDAPDGSLVVGAELGYVFLTRCLSLIHDAELTNGQDCCQHDYSEQRVHRHYTRLPEREQRSYQLEHVPQRHTALGWNISR